MLYVSFAEIYCVKGIESFTEATGDETKGSFLAAVCFFIGIIIMMGLDKLVHALEGGDR